MTCKLDLMLSRLSPEEQERIKAKADNLELVFKEDVVYMKDKDEEWCDGMFNDEHINIETIKE